MGKSLEDMARDSIKLYMTPYSAIKFPGHTLEVATKKAKAAHPNWVDVIDKVSAKMGV
jgi:hypothetical protein